MHASPRLLGAQLLFFVLSSGLLARALADTPSATFDHSTNQDQIATLSAQPGDTLRITIQNTCPDWFNYATNGATPTPVPQAAVPTTPATSTSSVSSGRPASAGIRPLSSDELTKYFSNHYCDLTSHEVFIDYNRQYGGYVVSISYSHTQTPTPTPPGLPDADYQSGLKAFQSAYTAAFQQSKCGQNTGCNNSRLVANAMSQVNAKLADKSKALRPVVETVVVSAPQSYVEFAGGITLSQLTDPQFALGPSPAGGSTQVIMEDRQAEDSWKIGFAGFIHVHDPNCSWWECQHFAASLGLGITNNSKVSVFIGPSYRLGGRWFVTLGYNWGSISRLPNGDHVGQAPQGASDLSNLGSRNAGAFFFSFSYAFLNPGSSFFQKPFQSNPTTTQSSHGSKSQ